MEENSEFEIAYARFLLFLMVASICLFIVGYAIDSAVLQDVTRYFLVTFLLSLLVPLFEKSQTDWSGISFVRFFSADPAECGNRFDRAECCVCAAEWEIDFIVT